MRGIWAWKSLRFALVAGWTAEGLAYLALWPLLDGWQHWVFIAAGLVGGFAWGCMMGAVSIALNLKVDELVSDEMIKKWITRG